MDVNVKCHETTMQQCWKGRRNIFPHIEEKKKLVCIRWHDQWSRQYVYIKCNVKIWWTNMKRRGWWSLCTIKNRRRINLAATVCRRNIKCARLYKIYSCYYMPYECYMYHKNKMCTLCTYMRRAFKCFAFAMCTLRGLAMSMRRHVFNHVRKLCGWVVYIQKSMKQNESAR